MEALRIIFHGIELDVFFDVEPYEPDVGLYGGVEVRKVEYEGCDVTEVVEACGVMCEIDMITNDEYEKV